MLTNIKYWMSYYAKDGYPDKRSMEDFVVVESNETLRALQAELNCIKNGYHDQ